MLAVDLFCCEAFIRLCIRVTNPNVEKGRAFSGGSRPSDMGGRGGGEGRSSRPRDKGGPRSPKTFFSALRASFWSKNKRGGGGRPPTNVNVEPGRGIRCSVRIRCQHFSVYLLRIFSISIFCYNSVACDTGRYIYNPISSV